MAGAPEDYEKLCASQAAQDHVLAQMQAVAKEAGLKVSSSTCKLQRPIHYCLYSLTTSKDPRPAVFGCAIGVEDSEDQGSRRRHLHLAEGPCCP